MLSVWRESTELTQQSQMIGSEATLSNNSTAWHADHSCLRDLQGLSVNFITAPSPAHSNAACKANPFLVRLHLNTLLWPPVSPELLKALG